jgi:hypothetical protein
LQGAEAAGGTPEHWRESVVVPSVSGPLEKFKMIGSNKISGMLE